MNEEKQKRDEIEVCFYIRKAEDIETSDFNSLILRLCKLRDFIEYIEYNNYQNETIIDINNDNIDAMQLLLNNFKIIKPNHDTNY